MRVWIKKRTGKLVPVELEPENQLKAVVPLAKVTKDVIYESKGGSPRFHDNSTPCILT